MPVGLIAPLVQAGAGIVQSILGGGQAKRAQNRLEKMVRDYQPNQSIVDFYNKALQRYNVNPYQSNLYRMQQQNAERGLATGLSGLGGRRSALAGVNSLVQQYNDSLLNAGAAAEGQQGQALNQLGQATGMKAGEDRYKFENQYNLLAMKAGGGNQIMNSGLQNLYGGLGNISNYYAAQQMYGSGNDMNNYNPNRSGRRPHS